MHSCSMSSSRRSPVNTSRGLLSWPRTMLRATETPDSSWTSSTTLMVEAPRQMPSDRTFILSQRVLRKSTVVLASPRGTAGLTPAYSWIDFTENPVFSSESMPLMRRLGAFEGGDVGDALHDRGAADRLGIDLAIFFRRAR